MTDEPLRILMVCTANQCRSPLAEVIARRDLAARGVDAVVVSAGLLAGGRPAAKGSRKVAKELGLDLSDHVSRTFDTDTVEAADVIITMGASHVLELSTRVPSCTERTLTLRELARFVSTEGRRGPLDRAAVVDEVHRATDRPLAALLEGGLDVEDPIGMPTARFRRTGQELTELIGTVLDVWFPRPG